MLSSEDIEQTKHGEFCCLFRWVSLAFNGRKRICYQLLLSLLGTREANIKEYHPVIVSLILFFKRVRKGKIIADS